MPNQPRDRLFVDLKWGIDHGWAFTLLNGKVPIRKRWQREDPLLLAVLQTHNGNIGLRTGQVSGVVVVDVDDLHALEDLGEPLPETVEVVTGGGGRHLYYSYDKPLQNSVKKLGASIDIRADLGQVVFPGSIHPDTRKPYRWAEGRSPEDIELAPLPRWVVDALTRTKKPKLTPARNGVGRERYAVAALKSEIEAVRTAREGTRNDTLNRAAYSLGQLVPGGHLNGDAVEGELLHAALDAGLSETGARRTIRSGLTKGEAIPREIPDRDNGRTLGWGDESSGATRPATESDGERNSDPHFIEQTTPMELARHFLEHRYSENRVLHLIRHAEGWYWYAGIHWKPMDDERIAAHVSNHFDQLWTLKRDRDGHQVLDVAGNLVKVKVKNTRNTVGETLFAIKACGTLVDHAPPCWLPSGDSAANLLPCPNGILDLQSGCLLPPTARLFCTWGLDFDYDPNAPKPDAWLTFLSQLWGDDSQSVDTLQNFFGLMLTADTRFQKMLLICGPKRSGKGTIARVLAGLLGKGNVAAPTLAGLASHFGMQSLIGKPLAIVSDARISGRTDQAVVIERLLCVSGEDAQTVDRKNRDQVTLTLPTRFLILTNELPRLLDSSGALAGRIVMLKLVHSFFGREDLELTDRFLRERPGILNWSLEGLRRLEARGRFIQPDGARDDLVELESLGAPVKAFVTERCTLGSGLRAETKALYGAWSDWCEENGLGHRGTIQTFSRDLRAAYPSVITRQPNESGHRFRVFEGISMNSH